MNNKGFAITTILFGTMILFLLLLVSLLGILSTYRNNLEKLIQDGNGARDIITIPPVKIENSYIPEDNSYFNKSGLYCFNDDTCKYYGKKTFTSFRSEAE